MKTRYLIPLLLLLAFAVMPTWADERILDFRSDIAIHPDSSMTVTETIHVRGEAREIRHGIFRTFPTQYTDPHGEKYEVGFKVDSVRGRDGSSIPHFLEHQQNGVVVYMGRKDSVLPPGEYTFVLTYTTTRQLGYFDDHDELYWNATGHDWAFPIDKASVSVALPRSVETSAMPLEAYTGPMGARGRDYKAQVDSAGKAVFETTRTLQPKEGLTIVVGFPKGIVQKPSLVSLALDKDVSSKIMLYGFIVAFFYYLAAWAWVGIDPKRGRILPRDTPPEGVSPAGMQMISRMRFNQDVFRTAIVSMAVKGFLRIEHGADSFFLVRDQAPKDVLAPEEQAIAKVIFASRHEFEIRQTDYQILQEAMKACHTALRQTCEGVYYVVNTTYFLVGVLLSLATIGAAAYQINQADHSALFPMLMLTGWTCVVMLLYLGLVTSIGNAIKNGGMAWSAVGITAIFTLAFSIGNIVMAIMVRRMTSDTVVAGIVGLNILAFAFYYLLKAPTAQGRALLDGIEGYRLWLTGQAKAAYPGTASAQEAMDTFNTNMPFALALGLDQEWSRQFGDALARANVPQDRYQPYWYRDDRYGQYGYAGWNLHHFNSSIGSAFQGAIASSTNAPGSSSGFSSGGGGGGSSGGGGGGGGGGGW